MSYPDSLFPERWHSVSEAVGYVRKDLLSDCGGLEVVNELVQLQRGREWREGGREGKERGKETYNHSIDQPTDLLTCCKRLRRVALSFEEKSFTTHGTIFFW